MISEASGGEERQQGGGGGNALPPARTHTEASDPPSSNDTQRRAQGQPLPLRGRGGSAASGCKVAHTLFVSLRQVRSTLSDVELIEIRATRNETRAERIETGASGRGAAAGHTQSLWRKSGRSHSLWHTGLNRCAASRASGSASLNSCDIQHSRELACAVCPHHGAQYGSTVVLSCTAGRSASAHRRPASHSRRIQ